MAAYEIEIKSLLGSPENAERFRGSLLSAGGVLRGKHTQLNHYFTGGDMDALVRAVSPHLSAHGAEELARILATGTVFTVRTREADGTVLLVVKASVDGGASENAVARLEFEEPVPLSLAELDALVQEAGFAYQAKWSREREEYAYKDCAVTIDKNAGYGFIAEFEKMTDDEAAVPEARAQLSALMEELGVVELPQDRLERMFAYYNANWQDYYGTDKTFIID